MEKNIQSYNAAVNKTTHAAKNYDIKTSLKSFWDKLSQLLADYAEMSNNPDPSKKLKVGTSYIASDQLTSAPAQLLLEHELTNIENSYTFLLEVFNKQIKFSEKADSLLG